MLNKELTSNIKTVLVDIEPVDVKLTLGCLIYSLLEPSDNRTGLRKRALAFKDMYLSDIENKKYNNRTIGYIMIEKYFNNNNRIKDLDNIGLNTYEFILENYRRSELEEPFHPGGFSPMMYGLFSFKTDKEKKAYKHLHDKILSPIIKYYKYKYDIPYKNLKIVSVSDTVEPGRELFIFIKDYPTTKILDDIFKNRIIFDKRPSVVRLTRDAYLHIII